MRSFASAWLGIVGTGALATGTPASALTNPLDTGPVADFFNEFRQQAIPRETVTYPGPEKAGTVVVSTGQRRLYYVLGGGRALRYGRPAASSSWTAAGGSGWPSR